MDPSTRLQMGLVLVLLGALVAGVEMLGPVTALPSLVLPLAVLALAVGTVLVGTTGPVAESGRPV